MRKALSLIFVVSALIFFPGCGVFGEGETQGYIYSIDDGILWDEVFFKPSMESTESDCYLLRENDSMKRYLKELIGKKIKLTFKKHLITIDMCPEGSKTEDEIISFEVIED